MSRPDFQKAQNCATDFLLQCRIKSLVFEPRDYDFSSSGIIIDTIQNYAKIVRGNVTDFQGRNIDGCYVVKYNGFNIILYDESLDHNTEHTVFGLTHELGHIFCGHRDDDGIEDSVKEVEANFFAAQVLMPEIVVYHILQHYCSQGIDSFDLMGLFGVSYEAASKRIKTFNNKGFWNVSERDQLLLQRFIPFIKAHYANVISSRSPAS
ncbi:MAG: ImmA/IrrE family metallo-endopeptidase [Oscillospiraceae bacterium]|nr:ImmA/IrrE family metallo-endopeptidase [Oscillospiraceae bacterium]